MGRVLGVDLGSRRIGLALSDSLGITASPLTVLDRDAESLAKVVATAREHDAERIVVGMPRSMSGRAGLAAQAAQIEIDALALLAGPELPVVAFDERLTTVMANDYLARAGVKARNRRAVVDQVAAAVLLQSWLDGRR